MGSFFAVGLAVVASASSACGDRVALGGYDEIDAGLPSLSDGGPAAPDEDAARPLCKSRHCPAPYVTCAGDAFECETNITIDDDNCGGCGVACPRGEEILALFHAEWTCQSGTCELQCDARPGVRVADCNGNNADGCEVNLSCDSNNCGACGLKCPDGIACIKGSCGCYPGLDACGDTACTAQCVDLKFDDLNCGRCGNACGAPPGNPAPPPNTKFGCVDSECGKLKCLPRYEDCNGDVDGDGCEINVMEDPQNCGGCGKKCADGQGCSNGNCICGPSEAACAMYGGEIMCMNLDTDPQSCGACWLRCPEPRDGSARAVCRQGRCELACVAGRADCDGRADNGCETLVAADPRNCGACGVRCDLAFGQPCVDGACLLAPCGAGGTQ